MVYFHFDLKAKLLRSGWGHLACSAWRREGARIAVYSSLMGVRGGGAADLLSLV